MSTYFIVGGVSPSILLYVGGFALTSIVWYIARFTRVRQPHLAHIFLFRCPPRIKFSLKMQCTSWHGRNGSIRKDFLLGYENTGYWPWRRSGTSEYSILSNTELLSPNDKSTRLGYFGDHCDRYCEESVPLSRLVACPIFFDAHKAVLDWKIGLYVESSVIKWRFWANLLQSVSRRFILIRMDWARRAQCNIGS